MSGITERAEEILADEDCTCSPAKRCITDLLKEVERLETDNAEINEALLVQNSAIVDLGTQNEKYREAMESFAHYGCDCGCCSWRRGSGIGNVEALIADNSQLNYALTNSETFCTKLIAENERLKEENKKLKDGFVDGVYLSACVCDGDYVCSACQFKRKHGLVVASLKIAALEALLAEKEKEVERLEDSLLYVNLKPCPQCEMAEKEITALKLRLSDNHDRGEEIIKGRENTISHLHEQITELETQLSGRTYCHSDEAVEARCKELESALEKIAGNMPSIDDTPNTQSRMWAIDRIAKDAIKSALTP